MELIMSGKKQKSIREQIEKNFEHLDSSLDHPIWANPMTRFDTQLPAVKAPDDFARELSKFLNSQQEANISPFYNYLISGKLPLEGVQEWARQFYFDVRCFPTTVAQIVANANYQYDIRQVYGLNLVEELGELMPTKEHPILFMKVGRALGLKNEEMEYVNPIPEVLVAIEYRLKLMKELNVVEAVAAGSFAVEGAIMQRYRLIAKTLKEVYGVSEDALEFFYVHTGEKLASGYGGDAHHIAESLNFIKKYATTAESQERVRQAVWRSVEARKCTHWGLFRHIVLKNDKSYNDLLKTTAEIGKKSA